MMSLGINTMATRIKMKQKAQAVRQMPRMAVPTEKRSAMMPAMSGAAAEPMNSMKF